VGLDEKLTASPHPEFNGIFLLAPLIPLLLAGLYLLALPLSFKRFLRHSSPVQRRLKYRRALQRLARGFNSFVLKNPVQRAVFYFFVHTFKRSRNHKLLLVFYLGFPLSFVLTESIFLYVRQGAAYFNAVSSYLLSIPLILYFFLALGLRAAVRRPVFLEARWLFQLAESEDPEHYTRGLKKALLATAVIPLFLLMLLLYLYTWGAAAALLHSFYVLAVGLLLLEFFFIDYRSIPFTVEHDPGGVNRKVYLLVYTWGFFTYLSASTALADILTANPLYYILFFALALAALVLLKAYRRGKNLEKDFSFEDTPEPVLLSLGLERMR
jgi:hypothetical protein